MDFRYYDDALKAFENNPYNIFTVFGGVRPILVLFLYFFKCFSGFGVRETVTFAPVVLNTLFVLSVFLFVWRGFGDIVLASFTAFMAAMSFKITVNMYSYFLANMLALIFIYLALASLMNYMKSKSKLSIIFAVVLFNLALFTHPWTYIQFSAPLALILLIYAFKFRSFFKVFKDYLGITLIFIPVIPSIILFSIFSGGQIQIILGLMNLVNVSDLHNYWQMVVSNQIYSL
ncbi:MAG: hypothetical protein QXI93_03415 [Candidatus Methanomethylicia archaeon]